MSNAMPCRNSGRPCADSTTSPPLSASASVLAFWRLGSDIDHTLGLGISGGFFSHWQAWLAMGVLLHVAGPMLSRYGRGDGAAMP